MPQVIANHQNNSACAAKLLRLAKLDTDLILNVIQSWKNIKVQLPPGCSGVKDIMPVSSQ